MYFILDHQDMQLHKHYSYLIINLTYIFSEKDIPEEAPKQKKEKKCKKEQKDKKKGKKK